MSHKPARRRRCKTCRTWTLTGLDEDLCAFTATTDPTPLTALGEAAALLLNLRTYLHDPTGRLWRRNRYDIAARPAGQGDPLFPGSVVADHHCRITLDAYRAPPARNPMKAANPMNSDRCPF